MEGNEEICLGEEENNNVVELDKNSPVLLRAYELMIRAVIKERLAILSHAQTLDLSDSGVDASGLWNEMPRLAREHEGSLED